jgi:hypothetical protein
MKYIRAASYRWRYFNLTKGKAQSIAVNRAIQHFNIKQVSASTKGGSLSSDANRLGYVLIIMDSFLNVT